MRWAAIEHECLRFVDFVVELGDLHKAIFHGPIAEQPIAGECPANAVITDILKLGVTSGACRPVVADQASPLLLSILHTAADGITRSR